MSDKKRRSHLAAALSACANSLFRRRLNDAERTLLAKAQSENEFLRALFDANPKPCFIKEEGEDGFRYVAVNPAFAKMVNLPRERILGRRDCDLFKSGVDAEARAKDEEAVRTRKDVVYERPSCEADFARTYRIMKHAVERSGRRCVLSIVDDVTEINETLAAETFKNKAFAFVNTHDDLEQMIRFLMEALLAATQSDHVLVHLADGTRRDVFAPDEDCKCLKCVNCALKTCPASNFGLMQQIAIEDTAKAPIEFPEGCCVKTIIAEKVVIDGRERGRFGILFTKRRHTVTAATRRLMQDVAEIATTILVRDEHLRALRARDTENAELVVRLREERDAALAAKAAKNSFFANIGHHVRTPLNAIVGLSDVLRTTGGDDPAQRNRFLSEICRSGRDLLNVINDLDDLSKLNSGEFRFIRIPCRSESFFRVALDPYVSGTAEGVTFTVDLKGIPPWLMMDGNACRRVISNLASNAVKFTEKGTIAFTASFDEVGRPGHGRLTLSISDSGCGMPPEAIATIGSPFATFASQSEGRGSPRGLGLAIAKGLVEAAHGTFVVTSTLGKGSTFTVTLPDVAYDRADETSVPKPHRRALVVDDSRMNLIVITAQCRALGFTDILTADNGRAALDILNREPVDVVLTDLWMPEMTGEQLLAAIREDSRFDQLPVYAVTADIEAPVRNAKLGFAGIILKPTTVDTFRQALGATLPPPAKEDLDEC